jgi:hypothetical protein
LPIKPRGNCHHRLVLNIQDASAPGLIANIEIASLDDPAIATHRQRRHVARREANRVKTVHPDICA